MYHVLLGIDSLATLAAFSFFAAGLADGTVSAHNIIAWLTLLGVVGGIVILGVTLRHTRRTDAAKTVLLVLAIPTIGAVLFVAVAIFLPPTGN